MDWDQIKEDADLNTAKYTRDAFLTLRKKLAAAKSEQKAEPEEATKSTKRKVKGDDADEGQKINADKSGEGRKIKGDDAQEQSSVAGVAKRSTADKRKAGTLFSHDSPHLVLVVGS